MEFEQIKIKIKELAKVHSSFNEDDNVNFMDTELLEIKAENLIIDYCEDQNYLVKGFPTEKRCIPEEELEEDYFCRERFRLYLDILTCDKEDVAELNWHFCSSFWPENFSSKGEFILSAKERITCEGFYDVTI